MKWEIKDEWINLRYAEIAHINFLREWNRQYWSKIISITSNTSLNNLKKMIRVTFNAMNDNKTFRNCILYHSKSVFSVFEKDHSKELVITHSKLECSECDKVLETSKIIHVIKSKTNPSLWKNAYDDVKFFCPSCFKTKRQIEKLKE